VYVPRLHYPDVPEVTVSAGQATYDPASQLLTWETPADAGDITIRITPR
jgi:Glycoside hydrolase family 5 C-terminal domain